VTAAAPPRVAHNRHPVRVARPDGGGMRDARVVVTVPDGDTPARLLAWTRPGAPAVDVVIDLAATGALSRRGDWRVVTDEGVYGVFAGRGCGCSSPVKHWQPFDPMVMGSL